MKKRRSGNREREKEERKIEFKLTMAIRVETNVDKRQIRFDHGRKGKESTVMKESRAERIFCTKKMTKCERMIEEKSTENGLEMEIKIKNEG